MVPRFPAYGGKAPFTREFYSVGGQVATAMVTCARLGLSAKYIGTVGDDERGSIQMESLRASGIDIEHVQQRVNCPNQSAYIVVDESTGERTIFWNRPDCLTISPAEITPDQITCARLLHIDGHDTAGRGARRADRTRRQHPGHGRRRHHLRRLRPGSAAGRLPDRECRVPRALDGHRGPVCRPDRDPAEVRACAWRP